jgi:hypothetical protein
MPKIWLRRGGTLLWASALVFGVFQIVERLGFSPTDDGYVLAQSYRILHGQVPHRDFISVFPAGSPALHVLDFAVPLPLLEATRLVGLIYTVLFSVLVYDRPVRSWAVWQYGATTVALLVNMHEFPVMGWPTIDALLLVSLGLWVMRLALDHRRVGSVYLAFVVLGVAGLMKQSFLPAPLLGFLFVATSRPRENRTQIRWWIAAGMSVLPLAVYVASIAWFGAAGAMWVQTTHLGPTFQRIFLFLPDATSKATFTCLLVALGAFLLTRSKGFPEGRTSKLLAFLVRIALTAVLIGVPISQKFAGSNGTWATQFFWALLAYMIVDGWTNASIDWTAVTLLGVAAMTESSVGYATPGLVGGSLLLCFACRIWHGVQIDSESRRSLFAMAALALMIFGAITLHDIRTYPYADLPVDNLNSTLTPVARGLAGIRTNETTFTYMRQMVACIRRYPASSVAVVPDNAVIYPVLHVRNPFPLDWLYPPVYEGSEKMILDAARRLNRAGDYLILFQPVRAFLLPYNTPQSLVQRIGSVIREQPLLAEIAKTLSTGSPVSCGSFVGRYSAKPTRG